MKFGINRESFDIDIIALMKRSLVLKKLQIPHPLLHERNFVLQPMQDLNLNWQHPILKNQ
jgi:2-amino-4-hydroxy-6-hydroxymethyldihydropteridine diphosphokinase